LIVNWFINGFHMILYLSQGDADAFYPFSSLKLKSIFHSDLIKY